MAHLLYSYSKRWNSLIINTYFDPISADKIHNTTFFDSVTKDKRVWKLDTNGDYLVRSAYKLCTCELIDITFLGQRGPLNLIRKIQAPQVETTFISDNDFKIKVLLVQIAVFYVIMVLKILFMSF